MLSGDLRSLERRVDQIKVIYQAIGQKLVACLPLASSTPDKRLVRDLLIALFIADFSIFYLTANVQGQQKLSQVNNCANPRNSLIHR